jgi:phosphoribosylformylglycinamidine synthase
LQTQRQILWQYCDASGAVTEAANPNGSVLNIAGIANERFNVAGLMPHPDRAVEGILGTEDGRGILNSMILALESRRASAAAVA